MDRLDPRTTALVLVDLQEGILPFPRALHSCAAVLQADGQLAKRFRAAGAAVVLTRVNWSRDFGCRVATGRSGAPDPAELSPHWGNFRTELAQSVADASLSS